VRRVLGERRFRWLWLGQLTSQFGNAVFLVMGLWEIQLRNPMLLSLAGVAMMLPQLLAALGGVVVDRLDARRVMLVTDLLRGAGVVLGLIWLSSRPLWEPGIVIAVLGINALGAAFFGPAEMVLLPGLVADADLPAANGLVSLTWQVTGTVGSALGGAAIAAVGASLIFGFDAASFWFSALAIALLIRWGPQPPTASEASAGSSGTTDWRAGWRVIRGLPWFLRLLPLILLTNFAGNGGFILLPYWVHRGLHASATWFGIVDASWGGGMVAGSLAAGKLGRFPLGPAIGLLGMMQSIMMVGFAFQHAPAPAVLLLTVAGAANGGLNALMNVALQRLVPAPVRGRAFGLFTTVLTAANPLASLAAGLSIQRISPMWWFVAMGVFGAALAGGFWRWVPAALGREGDAGAPATGSI
jgi:DHA3 family macrolide efflux protein-like MFS transporter